MNNKIRRDIAAEVKEIFKEKDLEIVKQKVIDKIIRYETLLEEYERKCG